MDSFNSSYYINPSFQSHLCADPEALIKLQNDPSRIERLAKIVLVEKKSLNELISLDLENKTVTPIDQEISSEELIKCEKKIVLFLSKFVSAILLAVTSRRVDSPQENEVIERFKLLLEDTDGTTTFKQLKQLEAENPRVFPEILEYFAIINKDNAIMNRWVREDPRGAAAWLNQRLGSTEKGNIYALQFLEKNFGRIAEVLLERSDDFKLFLDVTLEKTNLGNYFKDIINDISTFTNPRMQKIYTLWLAVTASRISKLDSVQMEWLKKHEFIKEITDIKKTYLVDSLTTTIIQLVKSKPAQETYEKLLPTRYEKKNPGAKLLRASIAQIVGQDSELGKEALDLFDNSFQIFKDKKNFGLLLNVLSQTSSNELLTIENRKNILKQLTKSKEKLIQECYGLSALYDLNAIEKAKYFQDSFATSADEILMQKIPFGQVEDLTTKYIEKFANSRLPSALMIYAAKMESLDNKEVMQALGIFATSVLNDTFKTVRYSFDDNIHLKTIFQDKPQLFDEWQKGSSQNISLAEDTKKTTIIASNNWLVEKLLTDKHLDMSNLPLLEAYLKDPSSLDDVREKLLLASKEERPRPEVRFQKLCLELCDADTPSQKLKILNELYGILMKKPFDKPEFLNDIKGLIDEDKKAQFGDLLLVDTDNPIDLCLCGTEVSGSCQRIDGDPNLNKGLLGYLLDGKNRLLAIKDKEGRIVARCLLRILWDGEKPVLFRERIYSNVLDDKYVKALDMLALEKAHKLGIPLTSLDGQGEVYSKPLMGLGGPAPFEYVDGDRGIKPKGKFEITGARLLTKSSVE